MKIWSRQFYRYHFDNERGASPAALYPVCLRAFYAICQHDKSVCEALPGGFMPGLPPGPFRGLPTRWIGLWGLHFPPGRPGRLALILMLTFFFIIMMVISMMPMVIPMPMVHDMAVVPVKSITEPQTDRDAHNRM